MENNPRPACLWLVLLLLLGSGGPLRAAELPQPPAGDLISQGLWWLYQLQYDKAEATFDDYIHAHPKDPEGYFYKTATDWWQLAQKLDYDLPAVQERFFSNFQKTIDVAEALEESAPNEKAHARALFYEGGAEGLKGRWLVTQKQWVNAYFLGKRGAHHLREAVDLDPKLYDAYMGLGIYDYFTDTLPGVQGVLAALLIHGDKKRGLQELQWAIEKGQHSQVEAKMFLIEIYTSEENTPAKALAIADDLHRQFPDSPGMHLAEISVLYTMHQWDDLLREAKIFLERSEQETPYYTQDGIAPARYCLGLAALYGRHDPDLAFAYMSQILENVDASRWGSFAYLRRGQVYDLRGERDKALQDYRTVLARPDFWGSHKEAALYLRKPFSD